MSSIPPDLRQALTTHLQGLDQGVRGRVNDAVRLLERGGSNPEAEQKAWRELVSSVPQLGVPILLRELRTLQSSGTEDPFLRGLLRRHAREFMQSVQTSSHPAGAESLVRALADYHQLYPRANVGGEVEMMTDPLAAAGVCFSSERFDYPMKRGSFKGPGSLPGSSDFELGWDYLPLIRATVEAGACSDPGEATRVLEDLYRIGGPGSQEIMDLVARDFQKTPEFARAYLRLFLNYPMRNRAAIGEPTDPALFQQRVDAAGKALTYLLPAGPMRLDRNGEMPLPDEDRRLFGDALGYLAGQGVLWSERQRIVNEVIEARPLYEPEILEMAGQWIQKPRPDRLGFP